MWTKEKPTKKGSYWFYGKVFGGRGEDLLEIINVLQTSNTPMYICCGTFVRNFSGVWWSEKIQEPELPV